MNEQELRVLVSAVEKLREDVDRDQALIQELVIGWAPGRPPDDADATTYPDWQTWVEEWLLQRISRSPQRYRWCHHYAEHPEVADRLEALWHGWEAAWPEPKARLTWFRDGLDHHWPIITADDGPLRSCSALENQHVEGRIDVINDLT